MQALREFRATAPATAGLLVFLLGGVLTALLAARALSALDYTIYAAFSSLWGIAMLAPASALEMETTLRAASARGAARRMAPRAALLWLIVGAVLWAPLPSWRQTLLGAQWREWLLLATAAGAAVFAGALLRGLFAGRWSLPALGVTNATTGVFMLGTAAVLLLVGVQPLTSILCGTTLAWVPGLVVLVGFVLVGRRRAAVPSQVAGTTGEPDRIPGGSTQWIVIANILMSTSLLLVPSILRWHVGPATESTIADVQLLFSLSRLPSTVILGLVPLMIAAMSKSTGRATTASASSVARTWLALAIGLAGLGVVGLALVGPWAIPWLTGRPLAVTPLDFLLATTSVLALAPALVLVALANAQHRFPLVVGAWLGSLVVLVTAWLLASTLSLTALLCLFWLAAAVPLALLTGGLVARRRVPESTYQAVGGQ